MTLRRLSIAMILCLVIGLVAYWLLPRYHINLPWYTTLIAFVAIFFGAILNADVGAEIAEGKRPETPESYDTDEKSFKIDEFEDRRH